MEKYNDENVKLAEGIVPKSEGTRALEMMYNFLHHIEKHPDKYAEYEPYISGTFLISVHSMTLAQRDEAYKILERKNKLKPVKCNV